MERTIHVEMRCKPIRPTCFCKEEEWGYEICPEESWMGQLMGRPPREAVVKLLESENFSDNWQGLLVSLSICHHSTIPCLL